MIIVSQDKTEIVNFGNTLNICLDPKYDELGNKIGYEIFAGMQAPDDNYRTLGCYKSEERAKEVLQGITRAYEKAGNIHFETDDDEKILNLTHNSNVFEMPEK